MPNPSSFPWFRLTIAEMWSCPRSPGSQSGQAISGFSCPFNGIAAPADAQIARNQTISFACYRLLTERFQSSPGAGPSQAKFDSLMAVLGYDKTFTSTDYSTGSPAALGNYIGQCIISYGLQDGANEQALAVVEGVRHCAAGGFDFAGEQRLNVRRREVVVEGHGHSPG